MARHIACTLAAWLFPLLLGGCLLAPGKFNSTLTVNADRSFSFSYVGEVYALDMGDGMTGLKGEDEAKPGPSAFHRISAADDDDAAAKKAATERKNQAIAEALGKEYGYRKVAYLGDGRFQLDYAITGTLTHNFVFPFNVDAQAVFPFVAAELRANGTVRVQAPAFANDQSGMSAAMGGGDFPGAKSADRMDGTFTLDTDAEIVSQNNENGPVAAGQRKRIVWTATPLTKTAPMAVLRLK